MSTKLQTGLVNCTQLGTDLGQLSRFSGISHSRVDFLLTRYISSEKYRNLIETYGEIKL